MSAKEKKTITLTIEVPDKYVSMTFVALNSAVDDLRFAAREMRGAGLVTSSWNYTTLADALELAIDKAFNAAKGE